MKNKKIILIGGLLAALAVVAVIGATNAYAQSPEIARLQGPGPGGGRGPLEGAALDAAAKALGMTTDALTAELKSGKTLAQVAKEKDVAFADVETAIQAVRGADLPGRGLRGGPGLDAAAQALGMTTDELTTALKSGKTLTQVAQDKGVEFAKVQAAMQAARDSELRTRIQQALDDGTLTQEHADWLLEGLDKGFLNGPGGFGPGFGGPHGRGPLPAAQPTQAAGQ